MVNKVWFLLISFFVRDTLQTCPKTGQETRANLITSVSILNINHFNKYVCLKSFLMFYSSFELIAWIQLSHRYCDVAYTPNRTKPFLFRWVVYIHWISKPGVRWMSRKRVKVGKLDILRSRYPWILINKAIINKVCITMECCFIQVADRPVNTRIGSVLTVLF